MGMRDEIIARMEQQREGKTRSETYQTPMQKQIMEKFQEKREKGSDSSTLTLRGRYTGGYQPSTAAGERVSPAAVSALTPKTGAAADKAADDWRTKDYLNLSEDDSLRLRMGYSEGQLADVKATQATDTQWLERKPDQYDWRSRLNDVVTATNPVSKLAGVADTMANLKSGQADRDDEEVRLFRQLEALAQTDPDIRRTQAYRDAFERADNRDMLALLARGYQQSRAKDAADFLTGQADDARAALYENTSSTAGKVATDVALTAGDMISAALTSAATRVPLPVVLGVTSGAEGAQRALDEGYDAGTATLYGLGSGLTTMGIEKLGGIAGSWGDDAARALANTKIGQAVLSRIPGGIREKAARLAASKLGRIGADALSEGTEEFAEYYAQTALENIALDKDTPYDVREAFYHAGIGSVLGTGSGTVRVGADLLGPISNMSGKRGAQAGEEAQTAPGMAEAENAGTETEEVKHTPQMQRIIREYQAAVDPGVVSFSEKVMNGEADTKATYTIGRVDARAGEDISELLGFNPEGYAISLNPPTVIHIQNRHGMAGNADHSMADLQDLGRIGYVLKNYDSIKKDPTVSKAFSSRDGKAAAKIVFGKRIDGTYYVVEAVPDSNAKKVHIVSAFIEKAGQQAPLTNAVGSTSDNAPVDPLRETAGLPYNGLQLPMLEDQTAPLDSTVPQKAGEVNNSIDGNGAEDASLNPQNLQTVGNLEKAPERMTRQERQRELARLRGERQNLKDAQQMLRQTGSTLGAGEVAAEIGRLRELEKARTEAARKLAGRLAESAAAVDDSSYRDYRELREQLRRTPIALAERDRADIGTPWGEFVRQNAGRLRLSSDGIPVDVLYAELTERYPELFPDEIIHPADQLAAIADGLRRTDKRMINPFDGMEDAGELLTEELLERTAEKGAPDLLGGISSLRASDLLAAPERMTREEYEEYREMTEREAQAGEDSELEAALDEADDREMMRRGKTVQALQESGASDQVVGAVKEATDPENAVTEGADLSDVAEMLAGNGKGYYNKDLSRVLDDVARGGKQDGPPLDRKEIRRIRDALYREIEKPWDDAKEGYVRGVREQAGAVADEIERLGIRPGSKESAAVQWLGEGQRQGKNGDLEPYSLEQLKRDFPDRWQNIQQAERLARQIYDDYVGKINAARLKIYPNIEELAQKEAAKRRKRAGEYLDRAEMQEALRKELERKLRETRELEAKARPATQRELTLRMRALTLEGRIGQAAELKTRYETEAARAMESAGRVETKIQSGEILRGKRLIPRKDYFHHFVELEQGFGGLMNILGSPDEIPAALAGVSEYTQPKSKFWGALLRREGGKYKEDAIGGLARYIPAAEYAIHIDPFIARMRGTIKNLAVQTAESGNANKLIEFLTDWTGDLAGKTNPADRFLQKNIGRKAMKALEWVNNRAKASAVVGNIGSALVQIGNIPNATTYVPNPAHWAKAARQWTAERLGGERLTEQSRFLQERFLGDELERLESKSLLRKGAEGMLELGDRQAAKLIWLAAYNQYESQSGQKRVMKRGARSYESAADYADDITRRSIAGRGIGERALNQKSRLVGLLAPFQVEVNNTFQVMKDTMREGDAAGIAVYMASAWMVNSLIEAITGNRPLFDPADALIDAIRQAMPDEEEEDERSAWEKGLAIPVRLGGEIVSNLPYASTAATLLAGKENSEKLFGEQDPTRYGTGNIAVQTILEPISQLANAAATGQEEHIDLLELLTTFGMPYGGKQLQKTIQGAQDAGLLPDLSFSTKEGPEVTKNAFPASRSVSGRIRFPIEIDGPADMLRMLTLGEWSTPEGREYIEAGRQPMSDKQTADMEKAFEAGILPTTFYNALIAQREAKSEKNEEGKAIPLSKAKDQKRLIDNAVRWDGLTKKQKELLYEAFGVSEKVW